LPTSLAGKPTKIIIWSKQRKI